MNPYMRLGKVYSLTLERIESVNLDFDALERECSLSFNNDLKRDIKEVVCEYEDRKSFQEAPPTSEVKKRLKDIAAAIDTLLPILECSPHVVDAQSLELIKPIDRDLWFNSRPWKDNPNERYIHTYLQQWRKIALEEVAKKGSPGRDKDNASRCAILLLHPIYLAAGGHGRGCHVDRISGEYTGPFYRFIMNFFLQVEHDKARSAGLGSMIMEVIPA